MFDSDSTFEIEGDEELLARLVGIERELKGARLVEAWERLVEFVASTAREYAPDDLGYLVASILDEVIQSEEETIGVIYSDLPYAPFQERGTDPYFPNLEALEEWSERHDTTAWQVALAIAAGGITAQRFFERSLTEHQEEIPLYVGNVVAEIIEEEY